MIDRRHSARLGSHADSMGTPGKAIPERAAPRLYLVTSPVGEPAALRDSLAAALKAVDVAAVLLRLAPGDERTLINRTKALAPVVQDTGAALLLDGHVEIVARVGADGAHLANIDAFGAALVTLKPGRIAGCGGLETRHDAMSAAEQGADYVMFGEPNLAGVRPGFEAVLERVAWWAEVFEASCVGAAGTLDEVEALVRARADFIAIEEAVWRDGAALAQAAKCLADAEPVP